MMKRVVVGWKRRHLRRSMMWWGGAVDAAREARDALLDAAVMLVETRMIYATRRWRHIAQTTLQKQQAAAKLVRRLGKRELSSGWFAWVAHLEAWGDAREMANDAAVTLFHRILSQAFRTWQGQAASSRRQSKILDRSALRMKHMALSAAFTTWRADCEALLDLSGRRIRAALAFSHRAVRKTFRMWYAVAQGLAHRAGVLQHALIKFAKHALSSAFAAWYASWQEQRRGAQMIIGAAQKWAKRSLSQGLSNWRDASQEQTRQLELLERGIVLLVQGRLVAGLAQWRSYLLEEMRRIDAKATQGAKMPAHLKRVKRGVIHSRVWPLTAMGGLCLAFQVWNQGMHATRLSRSMMRRAASSWAKASILGAMLHWQERALDVQKRGQMHVATVARVFAHHLRQAWKRWSGGMAEGRRIALTMRQSVAHFYDVASFTAFEGWRLAIQRRMLARDAVDQSVVLWCRVSEALFFLTWRSVVRRTREGRELLGDAVLILREAHLIRCWGVWRFLAGREGLYSNLIIAHTSIYGNNH